MSRNYAVVLDSGESEVLSLAGDIVRDEDGARRVRAHVVLGLRDGATRGGHLRHGRVWPTLAVVPAKSPTGLNRRYGPGNRAGVDRPP